MPRVSTAIDIIAPPSTVWAVLTDWQSYPEWNPFMVKLFGELQVGGKPTATIKPPNNSSGMTFSPVIQRVLPDQHLHWRGRLLGIPWLFTGNHHFVLHATETGTKFEQSEHFSGILALMLHWIGSDVYETTTRGFDSMNEALKARAEGKSSSGTAPRQRIESDVSA